MVTTGFLVLISGTVVGNVAIYKMTKIVDISTDPETKSLAYPLSGKARQALAIKKYREAQKDGPFYKMLQGGWVLNGVGFLIMVGSFLVLQ
jgi:hypothetical protein